MPTSVQLALSKEDLCIALNMGVLDVYFTNIDNLRRS